MKHFLISYSFSEGTEADWHQEIDRFIAALDSDPELKDRITYQVFKSLEGPEYYHLASPTDEEAAKILGERDFFKNYTQQNRLISGGTLEVTAIELVAETS